VTGQSSKSVSVPEEIRARLSRPTVRLSGSVGHPMVVSFFDQLLPVLEVERSILVELYTDGGDAEIGRRLAEEVRLLRHQHCRDMWFLGKTLYGRHQRKRSSDDSLIATEGLIFVFPAGRQFENGCL
jgi:hypothetical protein